MPPRKPFLLRVDGQVLASIQRWAADDMRSLNGQIEFLLRDALRRSGRLAKGSTEGAVPSADSDAANLDDAQSFEPESE